MEFRKTENQEQVSAVLAALLQQHLEQGERVLWLISGGSVIPIAVGAGQILTQSKTPLDKLAISLVDERYGKVGHADSNWQQLIAAGFDLPGATLKPVVKGKSLSETAEDFSTVLESELSQANFKIGLFGIGPDGHTSGILPGSVAVDATGLVVAYEGGGYQRITTTAQALARLDAAVVYAVGEAKWPVLERLEAKMPTKEQPAQLLKTIPQLTIFSDYKNHLQEAHS